jgi:hypothetical protein
MFIALPSPYLDTDALHYHRNDSMIHRVSQARHKSLGIFAKIGPLNDYRVRLVEDSYLVRSIVVVSNIAIVEFLLALPLAMVSIADKLTWNNPERNEKYDILQLMVIGISIALAALQETGYQYGKKRDLRNYDAYQDIQLLRNGGLSEVEYGRQISLDKRALEIGADNNDAIPPFYSRISNSIHSLFTNSARIGQMRHLPQHNAALPNTLR